MTGRKEKLEKLLNVTYVTAVYCSVLHKTVYNYLRTRDTDVGIEE